MHLPYKSPYKSVVTGDVVGSTELDSEARKKLPVKIRSLYSEIRSVFTTALPYDIDIFRGDSFQLFIDRPEDAMPIAILLAASIKYATGTNIRMSIATDTVEFLNDKNISESDGPAFRRSGRALNMLDEDHLLVSVAPTSCDESIQLTLDVISTLIDHLMLGWTEAQSQAVARMITTMRQQVAAHQNHVAETWSPYSISQQAVSKHLQSAHWKLVEKSFDWYRKTIGRIASQE